jgi:hypothetical protein
VNELGVARGVLGSLHSPNSRYSTKKFRSTRDILQKNFSQLAIFYKKMVRGGNDFKRGGGSDYSRV